MTYAADERRLSPIPSAPTAPQAVLQELRRGLLDGTLPPGHQVIQERVAKELGVSIVPLREALNTLVSEGLVEYRPRRGYFVTELSGSELKEIAAIRDSLESLATKLALPRLNEDDFARMADRLAAMHAAGIAGQMVAYINADRDFHMSLFEKCELPRLLQMIRTLWYQCDPYRIVYLGSSQEYLGGHQHEHDGILDLARQRKLGPLLKALRAHRGLLIDRVAPRLPG